MNIIRLKAKLTGGLLGTSHCLLVNENTLIVGTFSGFKYAPSGQPRVALNSDDFSSKRWEAARQSLALPLKVMRLALSPHRNE